MKALRVSFKAAQCGARVLSIKELGVETPTVNAPRLCPPLNCAETNDPCEAALLILKGVDVIITDNEEVREVTKLAKALIPIGRFLQYADFVCRKSQRGLEELRRLKLECPDYSYPRALFVADSLSPSLHFLKRALDRASLVEGKFTKANCLCVPEDLVQAYPFSQMECPEPLPPDLEEVLKKWLTCSGTPSRRGSSPSSF